MTTENSTAALDLPHGDFDAGYRVGWEAVHGNAKPQPRLVPLPPRLTELGYSRFTMGVRAGIEAALGVETLDDMQ